VRNAAAEAHAREVGEVLHQVAKLHGETREVFVQLGKLRATADVRVQHGDRKASLLRGLFHGEQVAVPDTVL
jgi:hypothetical protein